LPPFKMHTIRLLGTRTPSYRSNNVSIFESRFHWSLDLKFADRGLPPRISQPHSSVSPRRSQARQSDKLKTHGTAKIDIPAHLWGRWPVHGNGGYIPGPLSRDRSVYCRPSPQPLSKTRKGSGGYAL
jgi:hypothetical protein